MISIDFQKIYDEIAFTLPIKWTGILMYCVKINGSYEIKYYIKTEDCKYIDCFDLDVSPERMINVLMNICAVMASDIGDWKSITVLISPDGDFDAKADFNSTELSTEEYIDNWKKKYLT